VEKIIAQRIKGTLGITGSLFFRDLINKIVWHLDVGLSHPETAVGFKGFAVRK